MVQLIGAHVSVTGDMINELLALAYHWIHVWWWLHVKAAMSDMDGGIRGGVAV